MRISSHSRGHKRSRYTVVHILAHSIWCSVKGSRTLHCNLKCRLKTTYYCQTKDWILSYTTPLIESCLRIFTVHSTILQTGFGPAFSQWSRKNRDWQLLAFWCTIQCPKSTQALECSRGTIHSTKIESTHSVVIQFKELFERNPADRAVLSPLHTKLLPIPQESVTAE